MSSGIDEKRRRGGVVDGRFDPTSSPVKKILAVVGTAHVRGMLKLWPRISQPGSDLSLSKFVE